MKFRSTATPRPLKFHQKNKKIQQKKYLKSDHVQVNERDIENQRMDIFIKNTSVYVQRCTLQVWVGLDGLVSQLYYKNLQIQIYMLVVSSHLLLSNIYIRQYLAIGQKKEINTKNIQPWTEFSICPTVRPSVGLAKSIHSHTFPQFVLFYREVFIAFHGNLYLVKRTHSILKYLDTIQTTTNHIVIQIASESQQLAKRMARKKTSFCFATSQLQLQKMIELEWNAILPLKECN